jgi:hypothetical protein
VGDASQGGERIPGTPGKNALVQETSMKKFVAALITGIFFLSLPGPLPAQKEVDPPAIPPMLEDRPPLAQLEPKDSQAPAKVQEQKTKSAAKTKAGKNKSSSKAKVKKKGNKSSAATAKKKGGNDAKKKGVTAKPKQRKAPDNT